MVLLTELEDNNGCLTISALFASISNMINILYEKQPKIDWFFFNLHENIVKIFKKTYQKKWERCWDRIGTAVNARQYCACFHKGGGGVDRVFPSWKLSSWAPGLQLCIIYLSTFAIISYLWLEFGQRRGEREREKEIEIDR